MNALDVPGAVPIAAPDWQADAERAQVELARLRAQRCAVLALLDKQERRARDMVGIFSGKRGADVPAWVGQVRAALGGAA